MGYYRGFTAAGFEVEITGVDIKNQRHYPFKFIQADAMTFDLAGYDFIHASPPCQAYSQACNNSKKAHPDLVAPVRRRLIAAGVPYIIENVPRAPLVAPVVLCGTHFDLRVIRHRHFESTVMLFSPGKCRHVGEYYSVTGHGERSDSGKKTSAAAWRDAMGIDWMTRDELTQSIPPAYTEYLARQVAQIFRQEKEIAA